MGVGQACGEAIDACSDGRPWSNRSGLEEDGMEIVRDRVVDFRTAHIKTRRPTET